MIVLDTNVISEVARPAPNAQVIAWVNARDDLGVTATTVGELLYGVARLPDGVRKNRLADAIREMIDDRLAGKVLAFDRSAASHYADIVAGRERAGRPITVGDGQIGAICRARGVTLATRNLRDFADTGVDLVNPWTAAGDG